MKHQHPLLRTRSASRWLASATLALGLWAMPAAQAQDPAVVDPADLNAALFMQKCYHCHTGVLRGSDLLNTYNRPKENLKDTVTRMQQYAGPLTDEQIDLLVELLADKEVVFRIEEAKLEQEEAQAAADEAREASGAPPVDEYSRLFVQRCAQCHTMGPGASVGGDLTRVINYDTARVRKDVVRMQVQAGPLTDDQIDGLTALLKDNNRLARLEAAGLKTGAGAATAAPAGAAATPVTSTATAATTTGAQAAEQTTTVAQVNASTEAAHAGGGHETQKLPLGLLGGITLFTLLCAVVIYFTIWKEED